ncbi:uncharacterized protein LOC121320728 [Polyodon spathula]|uniref:uncharacterized protein LOC121320728 n=1 Tax=Polyodon spathula TaxID=7913 RepID=UPI001B7EC37A|nr:uncharacterized protein LOC121320728 [Polyodon spathula]
MLRRTLRVSLCILLLVQHITGEIKNIDGLQNDDIVLCPVFNGKLEEISWKLGNNKVAEYDSFKTIMYYGDFKNQMELNIENGCLTMNNITDKWDGLYTAEVQINELLQYWKFKIKVYRRVSKPNVICTVNDSNVTLLCEGDESLGNHYRWEDRENNRGISEEKNVTFSKEENRNIEYICIFSNPKSEERSDPVKNCFVPGGRSHILVLILVLLAVLVALILLGYNYFSQSKGAACLSSQSYQKVQTEQRDVCATEGTATAPLLAQAPPSPLETAATPPLTGDDSGPPPLETAEAPPPPGDGRDSFLTGDGRGSSPPGDNSGSSPPGDGRGSFLTGDGSGSFPPGDNSGSSPPGDGRDSFLTGDSRDSSHPGDGRDSFLTGDGSGSFPPGDNSGLLPPWRRQGLLPHWRRQGLLPPWRRQGLLPPWRRQGLLPHWRRQWILPPRRQQWLLPPWRRQGLLPHWRQQGLLPPWRRQWILPP